MAILKKEYLDEIRSHFSFIEQDVKKQIHLFDDGITHIAELFIEELLNIVFREKEYHFENLNYKKKNHPAVDIGDEINQIAWQITVSDPENLNTKIKSTLESLYLNECDKIYKKIYVFTLSGKPKKVTIPKTINVNTKEISISKNLISEENIWDLTDLYKYIEKLSTNTLKEIIPIISKIPQRPKPTIYKQPSKYIPRIITDGDVQTYISNECVNPEGFIKDKPFGNFEILKNPFFLIHSIEIYNSNGCIPHNKAEFFDLLLNIRIERENEKSGPVHRLMYKNNYKIDSELNRLALTLQNAGKYKFADKEIDKIINDVDLKIVLQRIILRKHLNEWRFEHNNFQEYIASRALLPYSWEEIKKLIIIPDLNKLRPRWLNTLTFLLNSIPKKTSLFHDLVQWFLFYEKEVLVKVETDKIDIKIQNQIFIDIFNDYKSKGLILWQTSFTIEELARFGNLNNNQQLIKFLLEELESADRTMESIRNSVSLLYFVNDITKFRDEIKRIYLQYLETKYDEKSILYTIFESLNKWQLFDYKFVNLIINNNLIECDGSTVSEIAEYLTNYDFKDLQSSYIFFHYKSNRLEDRYVASEKRYLSQLIELLSETELVKLIDSLSEINFLQDHDNHETIFESIPQASLKFPQSVSIRNAIISLMFKLEDCHKFSDLDFFKVYFNNIGSSYEIFKELVINEPLRSKRRFVEYCVPFSFMDEICFKWLIDQFCEGNFTTEITWSMLHSLSRVNKKYHDVFYENINRIASNKYVYHVPIWELFNKEIEKLKYEALLSKEKYIEYVESAFKIAGNDSITKEMLIEFRHLEDKAQDIIHNTSFELLWDLGHEETYTKSKLIDFINNSEKWNWFLINSYYSDIQHMVLPDKNLDWVRNWVLNVNTDNLDFIIEEVQNKIRWNNLANIYSGLVMYLDIIPLKSILLKMASAIGIFNLRVRINSETKEYYLSDFLLENLKIEELSYVLLENLSKGIQSRQVLWETAKLIEKLQVSDGINLLVPYIIDHNLDKYTRSRILDCFIKLKGEANLLIPALKELTLNHFFDFTLIQYFIENEYKTEINKILESKKNDAEIEFLKVGHFMIKCNNLDGFDIFISALRKFMKSLDRENIFEYNYFKIISLREIEFEALSRHFIEIIKIYLDKDFIKDEMDGTISSLFETLFESSKIMDSQIIFKFIDQIEKTLKESDQNKNYTYVFYYFSEFKEKVKVLLDKEKDIDNSIKEINKLQLT